MDIALLKLDEIRDVVGTPKDQVGAVVGFHRSFRDVQWDKLLSSVTSTVDIVVHYWDSWMAGHEEQLIAILKRPNTKIRIFCADPNKKEVMKSLRRLYPGQEPEELKRKIALTGANAARAISSANAAPERLEFWLLPFQLNYSIQLLDQRTLVLSTYDMFRVNRIGAPAFILDLAKDPELLSYWNHELSNCEKVGKQLPTTALKDGKNAVAALASS